MILSRDKEDLFWSLIDFRGEHECWSWTGGIRNDSEYGGFWTGSEIATAHVISWALLNDRDPSPGMEIRHKCGNSLCCNPAHMVERAIPQPGAPREKRKYVLTKPRAKRGGRPASYHFISTSTMEFIRNAQGEMKDIAARAGVSVSTAYRIKNGHYDA